MLTFIPTPIGNPQDITIRALNTFENISLFLCEDTRQTKRLLRILSERFDIPYPDSAEFLSFNEHNGKSRLEQIKERLNSETVAYLSDAGMPVISDPGQLLVEYCQEHNIAYDVLPGATAFATAYGASGFEEGHFSFHAFLPHKGSDRVKALSKALSSDENVILYESPHRLLKLLEEIHEMDPSRELFLAKELTKKFQSYYKGSVSTLFEQLQETQIKGEWVVVIKANIEKEQTLSYHDILSMDIAPKIKAKLLAKITGKSVKECYNALIESSNTAKI